MADSYVLFRKVVEGFAKSEYEDQCSLELDLDELRKDQDYLGHAVVADFIDESLAHLFKSSPILAGNDKCNPWNVPETRLDQIDSFLNFIKKDIRDGEAMLLSDMSKKRFGHTWLLLKEGKRHEVIENLINTCASNSSNLLSAVACRIISQEADEVISRIENLDAKKDCVRYLENAIGRTRLLKVGSSKIRHQLSKVDFEL